MCDQKDNVKVAIRVRPLNDREIQECAKISVSIPDPYKSVSIDIKSEQKCFTYDYVASEDVSQEEIFEAIGKPIALSCLAGYNGTIFAYGQTGAGKTFTILGASSDPSQEANFSQYQPKRGLLPRCFEYLFSSIKSEMDRSGKEYLIKCSYLEIYQEQINDLLDPNTQSLQLREDMKRGVYVEGLIEEAVGTVAETYNLLRIGTLNRHVGSTSMNKESSRSHSVFTLVIESKECRDNLNCFVTSRFHLIDLAGSERQKATDCAGERLKEAGMINKSLSALGNVINSLVDISEGKSRHIHYRDSKLTFLLKDSLGGNSKTCIVANISPAFSAASETLSTLKFAQRAKQIKNAAVVNEETSGAVAMLRYEIKKLKEELNFARENSFCGRCQEGFDGETDRNLLEILEKTLKLKQEENSMFTKSIEEKEGIIEGLRGSVSKLENKVNHDKMVVKFREATILRLQNNAPDESVEVSNLKKEIEILRGEIESATNSTGLYVENKKLKEELENLKLESNGGVFNYKERISELEEISCRLAESLRIADMQKKEIEERLEKDKSEENKHLDANLESNLENLTEKNTELELINESLREKLSEVSKKGDYLRENVLAKLRQDYESEKVEVISQNSLLQEQVKRLSELVRKHEGKEDEQGAEAQRKLTVLSKELSSLKCEYRNKDNECELLKLEVSNLSEANSSLNHHLSRASTNYQALENSYAALGKDLSEIKVQYAEQANLLDSFKKTSDYLTNYQQQYNKLLEEYETVRKDLEHTRELNKSIQEKIEDKEAQFSELMENNVKIVGELEKANAGSEKYYGRMMQMQQENKNLMQVEAEYQSRFLEMNALHEDLSVKLLQSTQKQSDLETCIEKQQNEFARFKLEKESKLLEANKEIKYLEHEINSEKDSKLIVKDLQSRLQALQEELTRTKSSLNSFQELNLSITHKNAELTNALGKMHSSHVPLYIADQLRGELSASQNELATLKEENRKKLEILKTTKSSINSTKNEIAMWKKSIDEKNATIHELRCELRRHRDEEGENPEIAYLRNSMQTKDKEIKELRESKGKIAEGFGHTDENTESLRKKCINLQVEVNVLKEELKKHAHCSSCEEDKLYKSGAMRENEDVCIKKYELLRDDFLNMKSVNNKLTDELKINVGIIEALQVQISELNKKLNQESGSNRQYTEEIENLTEGLAKITNYVFSLPSVKSNPEENSIVESTIRAISHIYQQSSDLKVLTEMENHCDKYKIHGSTGSSKNVKIDNMKPKKK